VTKKYKPNGGKILEMAKKITSIFHSKALQITQNWIFGMQIYQPSGNTDIINSSTVDKLLLEF
jgi:hypothetical protein